MAKRLISFKFWWHDFTFELKRGHSPHDAYHRLSGYSGGMWVRLSHVEYLSPDGGWLQIDEDFDPSRDAWPHTTDQAVINVVGHDVAIESRNGHWDLAMTIRQDDEPPQRLYHSLNYLRYVMDWPEPVLHRDRVRLLADTLPHEVGITVFTVPNVDPSIRGMDKFVIPDDEGRSWSWKMRSEWLRSWVDRLVAIGEGPCDIMRAHAMTRDDDEERRLQFIVKVQREQHYERSGITARAEKYITASDAARTKYSPQGIRSEDVHLVR